MKRYEFTITLGGYGDTADEAWEDATEGFSLDPGSIPDETEYRVGDAGGRLMQAAPALLEACKDGVKFLDSLIAGNGMSKTQLRMLSENRTAFRKILEAALKLAEKEV